MNDTALWKDTGIAVCVYFLCSYFYYKMAFLLKGSMIYLNRVWQ